MAAKRKKVNRLASSTQYARGVLLSFRHNREVSTNHFQIMAAERKEVDRLSQEPSTHKASPSRPTIAVSRRE